MAPVAQSEDGCDWLAECHRWFGRPKPCYLDSVLSDVGLKNAGFDESSSGKQYVKISNDLCTGNQLWKMYMTLANINRMSRLAESSKTINFRLQSTRNSQKLSTRALQGMLSRLCGDWSQCIIYWHIFTIVLVSEMLWVAMAVNNYSYSLCLLEWE